MVIELMVLALLPLLTRLVPHHWADADRWSWPRDGGLMVLSGVALVAVGGVWLMTFTFPTSPVFTSPDFLEYCGSVAAILEDTPSKWSHNRSLLAGWPSIGAARRLGVIDGLLAGALAGQLVLGMGLYLWGRALHSPLAGVAAVLCAATLVPLAALGRMLTFYPFIIGILTLATATTAVVWRWPSAWTAGLAGVGAGLAFLIAPRGLLWGLTIIPMAAVATVWDRFPRRAPLRWLALTVPVWLAWWAGRYAYLPHSATLEVLSDLTKGWQDIINLPRQRAPLTAEDGYIWGYSDPLNIPTTLRFLADQTIPDVVRNSPRTLEEIDDALVPLVPVVAGSAALALVGLRRQPVMVAVLLGGCVPFAVALHGAIAARFAGMRFLSNAFPFLALLMGLGWATLALGARPPTRRRGAPRLASPWRSLAAAGLLLVVVLGGVHTRLSPLASWRKVELHIDHSLREALKPLDTSPRWSACSTRILAEPAPVWIHRLPTADSLPFEGVGAP